MKIYPKQDLGSRYEHIVRLDWWDFMYPADWREAKKLRGCRFTMVKVPQQFHGLFLLIMNMEEGVESSMILECLRNCVCIGDKLIAEIETY